MFPFLRNWTKTRWYSFKMKTETRENQDISCCFHSFDGSGRVSHKTSEYPNKLNKGIVYWSWNQDRGPWINIHLAYIDIIWQVLVKSIWCSLTRGRNSFAASFHSGHFVMERSFEKQVCLGSGIAYLILLFTISLPNGFVLFVLLKNPLRFPRRSFTVFLAFICATDLFVGLVVSSGEALTRFLCAFGDRRLPQEGDVMRVLSYIGVNSSILLVTAMSIDRFIAVVFPHTYRQKWKPKTVVVVNLCIVIFSSIFASIQLSDISLHLYLTIDLHLHTTFPLCTTSMAYLAIFFVLKRQSRNVLKKQTTVPMDSSQSDRRQEREDNLERKVFTTSFLIVLFLILSLIPYFVITIVEIRCESCSGQDWFLALKESSIVFLHLNSVFNPFLSSFCINELKRSCAIVLGLNEASPDWNRFLSTLSRSPLCFLKGTTRQMRLVAFLLKICKNIGWA